MNLLKSLEADTVLNEKTLSRFLLGL